MQVREYTIFSLEENVPVEVKRVLDSYFECESECYVVDPVDPYVDEDCMNKCVEKKNIDVKIVDRYLTIYNAVRDAVEACSGVKDKGELSECLSRYPQEVRQYLKVRRVVVREVVFEFRELPEDVRRLLFDLAERHFGVDLRSVDRLIIRRVGSKVTAELECVVDRYDGLVYEGFDVVHLVISKPEELVRRLNVQV